jgi:beta-glucosidase
MKTGRLARWLGGLLGTLVVADAAVCWWGSRESPKVPPFTAAELAAPVGPALPEGFLWGTATSSHQIEGGNDKNDWSAFEAQPGRIAHGDRSGLADDHWNRVAGDVALMKALGANAYRFSLEWSRLEPTEGAWDDAAWAHYEGELRLLAEAGVTPMVTLLHFTLPLWIAARGGAAAPDFAERFGRFAAEAARRLGPAVTLWCTVNEPNVQMFNGYVEGSFAPGVKSLEGASKAFRGLVRGHAAAAAALRAGVPGARIGAAVNLRVFDPERRWWAPDWIAARLSADAFNWAFYDAIVTGRIRLRAPGFPALDEPLPTLQGSADWFGINYYSRDMVRFSPGEPGMVAHHPGPGRRTDLGWEIYPEGLHRLLRAAWARYRLPIYVTENGLADASGAERPDFLRAHVQALARAAREGVPVLGYFHWSLLDNFEWAEGFGPRFGLYRVDYGTMARTPAPGAEVFAALARETAAPVTARRPGGSAP